MQTTPVPESPEHIEKRQITRHQLGAYLQVFNQCTGRPIGYLGNVSRQGLMLISPLPLMVDELYELQLRLPSSLHPYQRLDFQARSHWCREDVTPGHFDTGFSLVGNQPAFAELTDSLTRYFSFMHTEDA